MKEVQLVYLLTLFYKDLREEPLFTHYSRLLNTYPILETVEAFEFFLDKGYINTRDEKPFNYLISEKGKKYAWTHMPFKDLWELYKTGKVEI